MNTEWFERLLYEEETATLDFKLEQYPFSKATDEQKSELLKDILGFANAWRRTNAYILIGVEDIRGGRGNVVGIPDTGHLDDHSLQQFVNNLTSRPVRFHYAAFGFEGKQVGVICIEQQNRPIYLKKDYGKLKKDEVYVRRGSSTDPSQPARIDEIAQMGKDAEPESAELVVEFADVAIGKPRGNQIDWDAEFCCMPSNEAIPDLDDSPPEISHPSGHTFLLPSRTAFGYNKFGANYFRRLKDFVFFQRLVKSVHLSVTNIGRSPAHDVRIEICVVNGEGVGILERKDLPKKPQMETSSFDVLLNSQLGMRQLHNAGGVTINKNEHRTLIEIECGNLQPGRQVFTNSIFVGIPKSGCFDLTGRVFASNLPQPCDFTLSIHANVKQSEISVDEVVSMDEPHLGDPWSGL